MYPDALGRRFREVNDPALPSLASAVGTAVVDCDDHVLTCAQVRDPHLGAEGERAMGGGQLRAREAFPTGGLSPLMMRSVPRGPSHLSGLRGDSLSRVRHD